MSKKDGGFAFTVPEFPDSEGMTIRDWFAGHALTGVIAAGGNLAWDATARIAYGMADAMLAERYQK